MNITEMKESDLDIIVELEKQCFKQPWNKEQCLYELQENPFSTGYLLKEDDHIVGYAFLWITFEIAQLARIGIDPACRNKGCGTYLMDALCKQAREAQSEFLSLEVRESNQAALKLYEKLGLIPVNVSKNYYPDGENAVVMSMAL